ncbi:MAG: YigZ family protein [Firmicutes bacterium]|nr:YigZ family protein [Bacillota bacterium]
MPPQSGEPAAYRTLGGFSSVESIIKRSRFIGIAGPAESEKEALEVIAQLRSEHPQATHHCYAFRVGLGAETARFSDDGEPGGTAGRPILEVLQREDLHNAVIVVIRYFGGVLLGAPGLVRAYSQTASAAVRAAGIVRQLLHARLRVELDYEWAGRAQHWLKERGAAIEAADYGGRVSFTFLVPNDETAGTVAGLKEMTGGRANPQVLGAAYRAVPDGPATRQG